MKACTVTVVGGEKMLLLTAAQQQSESLSLSLSLSLSVIDENDAIPLSSSRPL